MKQGAVFVRYVDVLQLAGIKIFCELQEISLVIKWGHTHAESVSNQDQSKERTSQ